MKSSRYNVMSPRDPISCVCHFRNVVRFKHIRRGKTLEKLWGGRGRGGGKCLNIVARKKLDLLVFVDLLVRSSLCTSSTKISYYSWFSRDVIKN